MGQRRSCWELRLAPLSHPLFISSSKKEGKTTKSSLSFHKRFRLGEKSLSKHRQKVAYGKAAWYLLLLLEV
jgi:hypothetical protein